MSFSLDAYQKQRESVQAYFLLELQSLRTGRAHAAMVESVQIEAYGMKQPLKGLASVTVSDARTISIEPWDKSIMKDIEKSLSIQLHGMSIANDGGRIRVIMSPLTQENRKELVKVLHGILEESRIRLRKLRDDIREEIITQEKNHELTQDDKYRWQKKLDEWISEEQKRLEDLSEKKEEEILTT